MTALLDPRNAEKLSKILGLTGSNRDGEALAAARKANDFLRSLGLTWADVIQMPTPDWRYMARACVEQGHRLSAQEFEFISNIAIYRCEPSEKQMRWLRSIFNRLDGAR